MEEENLASSSCLGRERLRWRVQTGIAVAVVVATLLLSQGSQQASAQSSAGGLPALMTRVKAAEEKIQVGDVKIKELEAATNQLKVTTDQLKTANNQLKEKTQFMSVKDGNTVFTGTNLLVVNGSGQTGGMTNGKGNLVVGYNEDLKGNDRTGSHNLVVGGITATRPGAA